MFQQSPISVVVFSLKNEFFAVCPKLTAGGEKLEANGTRTGSLVKHIPGATNIRPATPAPRNDLLWSTATGKMTNSCPNDSHPENKVADHKFPIPYNHCATTIIKENNPFNGMVRRIAPTFGEYLERCNFFQNVLQAPLQL